MILKPTTKPRGGPPILPRGVTPDGFYAERFSRELRQFSADSRRRYWYAPQADQAAEDSLRLAFGAQLRHRREERILHVWPARLIVLLMVVLLIIIAADWRRTAQNAPNPPATSHALKGIA